MTDYDWDAIQSAARAADGDALRLLTEWVQWWWHSELPAPPENLAMRSAALLSVSRGPQETADGR